MTLILNELHGEGPDRAPTMLAAADRRLSRPDGSYYGTKPKLAAP